MLLKTDHTALALCFCVAIVEGLDLQAAGLTVAPIRAQLGLSLAETTSFLTAGTIGLFFGALAGGRISDFFSRRTVLLISVALFGLFSILTAYSTGPYLLFFARLLTGIGIGGALPNLVSLVAESASGDARKRAVAWMFAGVPLGGALASLIFMRVGAERWHAVYYCGGLLPLLLVPLLWLGLPHQLPRPALGPAIGSTIRSTRTLPALFGGDRIVTTPLLWLAFCLMQLVSHLLLNWLPTLMAGRGFGGGGAALIQISYGLIGSLGCGMIGVLFRYLDARVVGAVAASWLIAMLIILPLADGLAGMALLTGLASAGMMSCLVVNYAAAPLAYPAEVRGTGVGAAVAIGRLGSIVGPILGGFLIGDHGSLGAVLVVIVPLIAIGALCSGIAIRRAEQQDGDPHPAR